MFDPGGPEPSKRPLPVATRRKAEPRVRSGTRRGWAKEPVSFQRAPEPPLRRRQGAGRRVPSPKPTPAVLEGVAIVFKASEGVTRDCRRALGRTRNEPATLGGGRAGGASRASVLIPLESGGPADPGGSAIQRGRSERALTRRPLTSRPESQLGLRPLPSSPPGLPSLRKQLAA